MIKLCVTPPLPKILGLSQDSKKLILDLPFSTGMNIEKIFELLAERHSEFALIYNDKNNRILGNLLIAVDRKILTPELRKEELCDAVEITFLAPYEGG